MYELMLKKLDKCLLGENVIKNFHDLYESDKEFKNELLEVLPEIDLCYKQEQNNPWHIYNVLDHILCSVENMNKQTLNFSYNVRRLLAYTMFFHDIGKPNKLIKRQKDGKIIDSFFGHNLESEKIASRVCEYFDFSKKEKDIICLLVKEHDIFMFIKDFKIPKDREKYWTQLSFDLIEDKINEYDKIGNGKQIFDFLLMVGKSDSLAQNPLMTKDSLKLLDKMCSMFNELENEETR